MCVAWPKHYHYTSSLRICSVLINGAYLQLNPLACLSADFLRSKPSEPIWIHFFASYFMFCRLEFELREWAQLKHISTLLSWNAISPNPSLKKTHKLWDSPLNRLITSINSRVWYSLTQKRWERDRDVCSIKLWWKRANARRGKPEKVVSWS